MKGTGITKAAEKAVALAQTKKVSMPVHTFSEKAEEIISSAEEKLAGIVSDEQRRFFAIKLLEKASNLSGGQCQRLALIRDKVFRALRFLCPAKLEGKDKGNLISVITSDIELLEVFYAHTISPIVIAFIFSLIMCLFIGSFHPILAVIALAAYLTVGVVIPMLTSKFSGDDGMKRASGRNQAVTNTVILIFDLAMLFTSALMYQNGGLE